MSNIFTKFNPDDVVAIFTMVSLTLLIGFVHQLIFLHALESTIAVYFSKKAVDVFKK